MGYKQWSLEGEISKPNAMYHHPQVITNFMACKTHPQKLGLLLNYGFTILLGSIWFNDVECGSATKTMPMIQCVLYEIAASRLQ